MPDWKHALAALLLVTALLAALACGGDEEEEDSDTADGADESAETVELVAMDFSFEPATMQAEVGQDLVVRFKNEGDTRHSFTVDEFTVDVEAEGGEEAEARFTPNEPGEFTFYCRYHTSLMQGALTVAREDGGAAGPTATEKDTNGGYYSY